MMMKAPRIEPDRLILTWPNKEQISQYHSDILGTNMFDTIHWEGPKGPNDLQDYWDECKQTDPSDTKLPLGFALIEKETNFLIGGASLRPVDRNPAIIDIGYALAPKFHGKGFATEAIKILVHEAFANRGAERIFARIFVGNEASKNVVLKIGFQFEGTFRRTTLKRGKWLDEWSLAITRPDWEKIK